MNNPYFEISLLQYLYSHYKLEGFEEVLHSKRIKPILNTQAYCSTISKYFRLMNYIDYAQLSLSDREYISLYFTNETDVEQNWNRDQSVTIYQKIIQNIHSRPKGYTEYRYDGHATENVEPRFLSSNCAPNNYITFGLYYTQFDENTEMDEFRNHNIVVKIVNQLQDNDVAVLMFSEVDLYRMASVNI